MQQCLRLSVCNFRVFDHREKQLSSARGWGFAFALRDKLRRGRLQGVEAAPALAPAIAAALPLRAEPGLWDAAELRVNALIKLGAVFRLDVRILDLGDQRLDAFSEAGATIGIIQRLYETLYEA